MRIIGLQVLLIAASACSPDTGSQQQSQNDVAIVVKEQNTGISEPSELKSSKITSVKTTAISDGGMCDGYMPDTDQALETIFSCSLGRKAVAICGNASSFLYRYGIPSKTEIEIVADDGYSTGTKVDVRHAFLRGAAGQQNQLRFPHAGHNYIVWERSGPDGESGGVQVLSGTEEVASHECVGNIKGGMDSSKFENVLEEDEDGPFEAFW